jgi:hypothetical protein
MIATTPSHPFAIRVLRPRDRKMILVVVEYANGGRGYARIERDKASLGGASLWAAVRQCQANGEIPDGVVTKVTRAH